MKLTEDELCEIFADNVRDSQQFRTWFLSKTKFSYCSTKCRLLHEEQMAIRPRKRWWRHWWCMVPGLNKGRETDIFMIFEAYPGGDRFAIHVENKRDNYKFNEGQALAYSLRARAMLNDPQYLSHGEYQTVLLATQRFRERYEAEASLFDVFISYEEVARFLPEFATALTSN